MSRVAKAPVDLPQGVTATIAAESVTIKGAKGSLSLPLRKGVSVKQEEKQLAIGFADEEARMHAGSTRAHLANMVLGVTKGYENKLELVGVGFRAAVQGKALNLSLGFSHPVAYPIPEGITIETPTPDGDPDQGHRRPEGRPGGRRDPRRSPAGALQGQGRALCERADHSQGREEEVGHEHAEERHDDCAAPRRRAAHIRELAVARLTVHRTPRHIYAQVIDARGAQGARRRIHGAEGR